MVTSLSNLVNNFAERIHKIKFKNGHDDKKCGIKYKDCECFLQYKNFKDDLIKYKCLRCNKNYQKKFDGNLKKRFFNLFYCCKKVFTHTNKWMIGEFAMKNYYLKKKILTVIFVMTYWSRGLLI